MATPVRPIARPLTAPSRAPSSMAREVPIPCDADPNASPRAMGLVIPHLSSTHGPMRLPTSPVRNTTTAVTAGSPPESSDKGMAMGMVADLGWSEAISFASRPKRCRARGWCTTPRSTRSVAMPPLSMTCASNLAIASSCARATSCVCPIRCYGSRLTTSHIPVCNHSQKLQLP